MEGSKLGFQVWMVATFLLSTNLKPVSSMKLRRHFGLNQRLAWFLAHRLGERAAIYMAMCYTKCRLDSRVVK